MQISGSKVLMESLSTCTKVCQQGMATQTGIMSTARRHNAAGKLLYTYLLHRIVRKLSHPKSHSHCKRLSIRKFSLTDQTEKVITATQVWLERAVIGLNLCPFAKSVHLRQSIRYCVSEARNIKALSKTLVQELSYLQEADPDVCETTLLIHPYVLNDFLDYNDFLAIADEHIEELDLYGEIQIASFHPNYRFAGSGFGDEDITNFTNRSPYPLLHLIRETSIERALASIANPAIIFERNIKTMQRLGNDGWKRLWTVS